MADRYLRATGNWTGAVWAATSAGTAGSAATPTSSDFVHIDQNYTVTLTADASCDGVAHTAGTLSLNGHKLTLTDTTSGGFSSTGATARTLNMSNGTLEVTIGLSEFSDFTLGGSGLTISNASSSLVTINHMANSRNFDTLSATLGDVIINLGGTSNNSVALSVTGSPTFHSLIIQSKNTAAHTVTFDNGASITFNHLVLVGSSATNKLTIQGVYTTTQTEFFGSDYQEYHTVYGQYVAMLGTLYNYSTTIPVGYIGSSSTADDASWLIQDPPKMNTLSDALTTAPGSNAHFEISGTITTRTDGFGGGGYHFSSSSSITSAGTYDLLGSRLVFERPIVAPGTTGDAYFGVGGVFFPQSVNIALWAYTAYDPPSSTYKDQFKTSRYAVSGNSANAFTYPIAAPQFIRFEVQATGYFTLGYSADAKTWTTVNDGFLSATEMLLMRAARIHGEFNTDSYIGSIGMLPAVASATNFLPFFI